MNHQAIIPLEGASGEATIYRRMLMTKGQATREAYATDLADFARFLGLNSLENLPDSAWHRLGTEHVAAYLESLKTRINGAIGERLSTSTIARRMAAVRELLKEAVLQGKWSQRKLDYVASRLKPPQVTHQHRPGITHEEQVRILEAADAQQGLKGARDYALLRLWLDTGLRSAEVAALKTKDLMVREGQPVIIVRHGKGDRQREVGIEAYTAHVVQQWLSESGQARDENWPIFVWVRKFGRGEEAEYRVVNSEKHLSGVGLWMLVKRYAKAAGIESEISPHSFRVAWVTDSLNGGAPLRHVTAAGGWTTSAMPERIYDRGVWREPVSRYRKRALPRRKSNGHADQEE